MPKLTAGERRPCSACSVEIIGAATKAGKVAPIETREDDHGNCILFHRDGTVCTAVVPVDMLGRLRDLGVPTHLNHYAACPAAEQFRHRAE